MFSVCVQNNDLTHRIFIKLCRDQVLFTYCGSSYCETDREYSEGRKKGKMSNVLEY